MDKRVEILSRITGISVVDLEYKNEIEIIRPSEAIEAMQEYSDLQNKELKDENERFKKIIEGMNPWDETDENQY